MDQKFANITLEIGEQDDKMGAALILTGKMESWSHDLCIAKTNKKSEKDDWQIRWFRIKV